MLDFEVRLSRQALVNVVVLKFLSEESLVEVAAKQFLRQKSRRNVLLVENLFEFAQFSIVLNGHLLVSIEIL